MSESTSDRPATPHQIVPTGPSSAPSAQPSLSVDASGSFDEALTEVTPSAGPHGSHPSDTAKETAKETAEAAKDTASAMFEEMKAAVTGASKREPYPWLALASAIAAVVWLLWPEDDKLGAQNLKLWTVFVVLSVSLVFTPMVRKVFRLPAERAWQFCVAGAAGFGFAWVAFLLPTINTNQAFFGTIGFAAAGLAAWTAPGKPE